MSANPVQDRSLLAQSVKTSIKKAEKIVARLRRTNTSLLTTTTVSSAASTLVAGVTAAMGPIIGEGPEGWRAACLLAAILAFVSTVATGVSQQLKISDQLSEGKQCVGRLRILDVGMKTGRRSWDDIVSEFEEIAQAYPEFIG